MILTCPACGTQYMVKDGAIPPQGRQVRCASCGNSWKQLPEEDPEVTGTDAGLAPPQPEMDPATGETSDQPEDSDWTSDDVAEGELDAEESSRRADEAAVAAEAASAGFTPTGAVAPPGDPLVEPQMAAPAPPDADAARAIASGDARAEEANWDEESDDFSPFAERQPPSGRRRRGIVTLIAILILVALAATAIWIFAPDEWGERLGLASTGETELQLMMTHSDRQTLASGNELLAVSGRVINPTEEDQPVPPIHAQLHSSSGQLVYSWTIPPPARTLPPGGSASFNSAELNVPAGGDELTVTIGEPKA